MNTGYMTASRMFFPTDGGTEWAFPVRLDHVPDVPPPVPSTPPYIPPEVPTELPPAPDHPPIPLEQPPVQEPPPEPGRIIVVYG